jgi:LmbE family N-acetylglucosaminyl deacetylase
MTMSDLTLMAVHAHPDDESSSTGGVFARYSQEGMQTVLVTCTNGELGDGPDHVKPDEDGHDPQQVAKTRLGELDVAVAELGVAHLELLGYHDSGMADWRFKHDDHAFANVPLAESVGRLAGLFEQYRPDVVITYDDNGGYNHPDHLQAHRITVAAYEETGIPAKLYFIARRRRDWERMREIMLAQGIDIPTPLQRMDDEQRKQWDERMAAVEKRITTTVDTLAYAEQKRAALAAHASQLDESWWVKMPPEAIGQIFAEETFIRAFDRTGEPVPETDLFAGLR